jgi:hypothetical protein
MSTQNPDMLVLLKDSLLGHGLIQRGKQNAANILVKFLISYANDLGACKYIIPLTEN